MTGPITTRRALAATLWVTTSAVALGAGPALADISGTISGGTLVGGTTVGNGDTITITIGANDIGTTGQLQGGSLNVTGGTTLTGGVNGGLTVNDTGLTVTNGGADISGGVIVQTGGLTVTDGGLDMTGDDIVNAGNVTATGAVSGDTLEAANGLIVTGGGADIFGNSNVDGTLGVTALATLNAGQVTNDLNVDGVTTLDETTVDEQLTANANADFNAGVDVLGGNLNVTDNVNVDGNTRLGTVGGNDATTVNGSLAVAHGSTVLNVNSAGLNVVVGPNSGHLEVENDEVRLSTTLGGVDNGFRANATTGTAAMFGGTSATMTGGGTSLALTSSGATFANGGSPVKVTGVANGVDPFDAVNKSQLDNLESKLSAGIASTIAMTQIPGPTGGKTYAFGIGSGFYNGESALAMGLTMDLDSGMAVRSTYSHSSVGGGAFGLGVGYSW